jgi:hypothetical protein
MSIFSQDNIIQIILPFFSLTIAFVSLILGLDVIWRVQKHLKTFMFLLTMTLVLLVISESGLILGMDSNSYWHIATECINVITGFLFLFAFLQMYKITRVLDNENDGK